MQPLSDRDPRRAGRYEIVGRLGSGAMGRVFLGRGPDARMAAIKIVHDHLATDSTFRERFRREVNAARRVSGPHTAAVIDADPEAEQPWMAVEYVEGPNLEEQIRSHGPLNPAQVQWLAQGMALALSEIHRAGVIHRDLKPTNVLLSPTGPRVIDFGIARSSDASAITSTGMVTGSPAFMSPEQATSGEVTQKSDIFCLGAVLFYAATGRPVHGDGPAPAMLYRVVHDEPDLGVITDPELHGLIAACLRKDPNRRPALQALASYASHPAGHRDPRLLAPPAAPRPSAYSPTQVIGAPDQEPARTQYMPPVTGGRPPGGAGQTGPYEQHEPVPPRRSVLTILIAAVVVLLLIGGAYVVHRSRQNGTGTTATPGVRITSTSDTRAAQTTSPPQTQDPVTTRPPATDADPGPDYLYQHSQDLFGIVSGGQRDYTQDGFSSQDSTSFRVSCTNQPWSTSFDIPSDAQQLTGTLLLDPEVTPDDLEVEVGLYIGNHRLDRFTLDVGDPVQVNETLTPGSTLTLRATAKNGDSCDNSPTAYGVFVDGAYS